MENCIVLFCVVSSVFAVKGTYPFVVVVLSVITVSVSVCYLCIPFQNRLLWLGGGGGWGGIVGGGGLYFELIIAQVNPST